MKAVVVGTAGLLCALLWLILLVVTGFNAVAVSFGLLGMLAATSSSVGHVPR